MRKIIDDSESEENRDLGRGGVPVGQDPGMADVREALKRNDEKEKEEELVHKDYPDEADEVKLQEVPKEQPVLPGTSWILV